MQIGSIFISSVAKSDHTTQHTTEAITNVWSSFHQVCTVVDVFHSNCSAISTLFQPIFMVWDYAGSRTDVQKCNVSGTSMCFLGTIPLTDFNNNPHNSGWNIKTKKWPDSLTSISTQQKWQEEKMKIRARALIFISVPTVVLPDCTTVFLCSYLSLKTKQRPTV